MKNLMITLVAVFMASTAYAQNKKTIVDIDKELKQSKSTATAMALIESIAETIPQTEADVTALGQLIDKYPSQGQKALAKIKDPKLAKAVMKECDRQVAKFKADKDKDWKILPEAQRHEKFNALLNSHAMIAMLGDLKNKEALPFLKQYITPEYDGVLSYEASKAIGRIAPDDPAVYKELWDNQGVKSISYSAYGKSVLKEAAQKMQDPNLSQDEKRKVLAKSKVSLLGGRSADEKELIKDILLNHPDTSFREEVSVAMVHAVINNPQLEDKDFVVKWSKRENSLAQNEVVDAMNVIWDLKFVPELLRILQTGSYSSVRMSAARSLGRHGIKESLPYLEECIVKDKEATVRGECRSAYWKIAGKIQARFHPEDVPQLEGRFARDRTKKFYEKLSDNDPSKIYYLELQRAFEEYRKSQK